MKREELGRPEIEGGVAIAAQVDGLVKPGLSSRNRQRPRREQNRHLLRALRPYVLVLSSAFAELVPPLLVVDLGERDGDSVGGGGDESSEGGGAGGQSERAKHCLVSSLEPQLFCYGFRCSLYSHVKQKKWEYTSEEAGVMLVVHDDPSDRQSFSLDDTSSSEESLDETRLSLETTNDVIPYIGKRFATHDAAYEYYSEFAKQCGFSIRRHRTEGKDGVGKGLTRRYFVCHRAGNTPSKTSNESKPREIESPPDVDVKHTCG
ncbi:hypothetical protein ACLB2K_052952 [Fragaria x ananassa]